MKKTILSISLVLTLSTTPQFSVTPAAAAELEEILVTARKRSESLQDVPIAIKAFTKTTIEQAGIERPSDFISLIPNVTIVDTANVGDTQVSIRGIVSNAVAGAILVTTKKPGDEPDGKVKVGLGSQGSAKISASYSGPLSDTLKGSFSYSHRETDGHFTNIFTGADDSVDFLEDDTGRIRLLWDANDQLSFDMKAGVSQVSAGAINFNAAFAIPAFVTNFGSPTFNSDVNELDFRYVFNVPGENEQETSDFSLKMDYSAAIGDISANITYNDLEEYLLSDGTSATFYGYELTPACQADRATLNSFTRADLFGPAFQPFGVLPPGADFAGVYGPYTPTSCDGYQYQERNQNDISAEVRITSPQDSELRWLAGAYATQIEREVVVAYGADQGLGFLRQAYVAPLMNLTPMYSPCLANSNTMLATP